MRFGRFDLDLSTPRIMGVLNVTPDSFSDGGQYLDPELALDRAWEMVEQGADFIDIGGESTRPGAADVALEEELRRVVPLLKSLVPALPVPVSIDTSKPEVMRAACDLGVALINDVRALRAPGALQVAASGEVAVCLMHMQGEPRQMQENPCYTDVVSEVRDFLYERLQACEAAGIARERVMLDPGFGFGKTLEHNLALLRHLADLLIEGRPLLIGVSRKSMIAKLLGDERSPARRIMGSVAAALWAVQQGAQVVRVHDVQETRDALQILKAVKA
ncbi:Dihydropteroate synthase [Ectothiorhodosinus mongolicus]|uniref:Dihydropteroate synthase n=1 Tax=Ectothiorhodosinus mongolicus TaxID=233100 RepID=A0A1R3VNR5_9GAMM|nr:dihydropteroate synthase [Ectothiorhodosinus mongolicus]ULX56536.1 dihydropteroate synthase [Ectothiorhodosinus mongolicus]SIT66252.1 Dihydropteroate synthase [Ectothiorhodosinus mongolicus]